MEVSCLKDDLLFFGEFRPTKCFERCQWGYAAAIPYPHFRVSYCDQRRPSTPLLDGVSLPQSNMSLARGHGIDLGPKDSKRDNRSICSECGARWPYISISLEPVSTGGAKAGYSARIEMKKS